MFHLIFFNFILVLINQLWLPVVVGGRQLKRQWHRSQKLHPKLGMYIFLTYILFRSKRYGDKQKEKKARKNAKQIMMFPSIAPSKRNILIYIHHLFAEDQLQFVNYLLISPLLLLQFWSMCGTKSTRYLQNFISWTNIGKDVMEV